MDSDTLRMFYARFKSLVSIFQQINSSFSFEKSFSARPVIPSMASLSKVIDYCTLVGLYDHGFYTLVEPPFLSSPKQGAGFLSSQSVLKLLCCDPGLVMKPIFTLFKHVIITSGTRGDPLSSAGTLSPLDFFPKLLQYPFLVKRRICIDPNTHICPVVVSRGNDQVCDDGNREVLGQDDGGEREGGEGDGAAEDGGEREGRAAVEQVHAAQQPRGGGDVRWERRRGLTIRQLAGGAGANRAGRHHLLLYELFAPGAVPL